MWLCRAIVINNSKYNAMKNNIHHEFAYQSRELGYTREQVGKITVTDFNTYVAVARNIAQDAVRKLSVGKIKGKTVKVRTL